MQVCKTCKRSDLGAINKALVAGETLRNISKQHKGATVASLQRHKENCIKDLFVKVIDQKRAGLLGEVDKVKKRIDAVAEKFADNGQVQVQLIARQLDVIDKEAKLTGAYTKDKDNPANKNAVIEAVTRRLIEDRGWSEIEAKAAATKYYNTPEMMSDAVN
jgi:hypothetical protein